MPVYRSALLPFVRPHHPVPGKRSVCRLILFARRSFPLLLGAVMLSCDGNGGLLGPERQTWVATEPIQCLGNPWEQDWLERHGNIYTAYPHDPDSQKTIIREYYARLGIEVDAVVSVPRYRVTCDACSCPRGDTLYLLVGEQESEAMIHLGYRREEPRLPDTPPVLYN